MNRDIKSLSRCCQLCARPGALLGAVLMLSSSALLPARSVFAAGPPPPKPKITAKQAEAAAARKLGGKAVSSKYEFEDNRWQWAVIVQNKKGQMYEAEVNATTGKVMSTEKTSPAEEAKEEAADRKKAAGKPEAKTGGKKVAPSKSETDEKDEKDEPKETAPKSPKGGA